MDNPTTMKAIEAANSAYLKAYANGSTGRSTVNGVGHADGLNAALETFLAVLFDEKCPTCAGDPPMPTGDGSGWDDGGNYHSPGCETCENTGKNPHRLVELGAVYYHLREWEHSEPDYVDNDCVSWLENRL